MSLKKTVIIILGFALFVPFILVRDVYPFYRFGMFAKSAKNSESIDSYHVTTISYPDSVEKPFHAYPSQALIRQHIYRKESRELLKKFHNSLHSDPERQSNIISWQLYTIHIPVKSSKPIDTILTDQLFIK